MSQSPPLLLLLAVTCCLLARCSCQRTYFCDTLGSSNIRDSSFYLVTHNADSLHYDPRINCSFSAASGIYWIEVLRVDISSRTSLTVTSGSRRLLQGHKIQEHAKTMMTWSGQLRVEFRSGDRYAGNRRGVTLRVRAVSSRGCPPGWRNYTRYCSTGRCCIGSSSSILSLPFREAQQACTNMRANLLLMSSGYSHSIRSILPLLPSDLRHDAWIGLTDLRSRHSYTWLHGWSYRDLSSITCNGRSYSSCNSWQRCATLTSWSAYDVEMVDCSLRRRFICVMPTGGATRLYTVPSRGDTVYVSRNLWWIWIPVASVIFIGFFVAAAASKRRRQQRQQRQQQQRPAVWAVTLPPQQPPPPNSRPQQPVATATPPYPKPPPYGNLAESAAPPPPSYTEALQHQGQQNHAFAS